LPSGFNAAQVMLQQASAALRAQFSPQPGTLLTRVLQLDDLMAKRDAALDDPTANFYDGALRRLGIGWHCPATQTARIPKTGPLILVANHPTGFADGLILGSLLALVRPDFKFLGNAMLSDMAPAGSVICLNLSETRAAVVENARALRQALQWLGRGGAVIVFPSGEVASFDWPARRVREPAWKDTAARLAMSVGATVVPVGITGTNSVTFHAAGLAHPRLRTALLVREALNKPGTTLQVKLGRPLPPERLTAWGEAAEVIQHLEWRSQLLSSAPTRPVAAPHLAIVPAQSCAAVAAEVSALPALIEQGHYAVYSAVATQIPHTLREIGRLREVTFRGIGEGTGAALDLDRFDTHYQHLFLWNHQKKEVIGAYRVARTNPVLSSQGPEGLYTGSLFRITPAFFAQTGPALELGRSFVRQEYQGEFAPLHLLWKGIGALIKQNPEIRTLFGAVSISNGYSRASQTLMAQYLRRHRWHAALAAVVTPRCSSPVPSSRFTPASLDEVADLVEDVESDGKGLPVLLRHYLNLNGQAVALHRDRKFSNVLDALVVVELDRMPPKMKARYLA